MSEQAHTYPHRLRQEVLPPSLSCILTFHSPVIPPSSRHSSLLRHGHSGAEWASGMHSRREELLVALRVAFWSIHSPRPLPLPTKWNVSYWCDWMLAAVFLLAITGWLKFPQSESAGSIWMDSLGEYSGCMLCVQSFTGDTTHPAVTAHMYF